MWIFFKQNIFSLHFGFLSTENWGFVIVIPRSRFWKLRFVCFGVDNLNRVLSQGVKSSPQATHGSCHIGYIYFHKSDMAGCLLLTSALVTFEYCSPCSWYSPGATLVYIPILHGAETPTSAFYLTVHLSIWIFCVSCFLALVFLLTEQDYQHTCAQRPPIAADVTGRTLLPLCLCNGFRERRKWSWTPLVQPRFYFYYNISHSSMNAQPMWEQQITRHPRYFTLLVTPTCLPGFEIPTLSTPSKLSNPQRHPGPKETAGFC